MLDKTRHSLGDYLNIIWTLAFKDIVDALKNRIIIAMIIVVSMILLMPKTFPLIFEQPETVLPIFDMSNSQLMEELKKVSDISVQKIRSEQELRTVLCSAMYPLIGLQIPVNFDQTVTADRQIEFQGYVCWSKRNQVSELRPKLEGILSQSLGRSVTIHTEGNIVYPPSNGVLLLSMTTINSVFMIMMMGFFLVPSLLFEEKETKTIQALLVSPASIGQVVIGKALAGLFYLLVAAVIIFTISWAEVIHWDMVILFVIAGGIFSVAVGLILGSFAEKQQDIAGWITVLVIILVGTLLLKVFNLELPALVESILPWIPSVALAELCRAAYAEVVPVAQIWNNLGIVLIMSLPLYALVIWKVRRSDR